ncbi:hypothetical protein D3C71_2116160 [compost metagenome]
MHAIRLKPETVHATVNLQVDIKRGVQPGVLQRLDLPVAVHAGGEAVLIQQRQFVAVKKALK